MTKQKHFWVEVAVYLKPIRIGTDYLYTFAWEPQVTIRWKTP